jgi:hypothetical protein
MVHKLGGYTADEATPNSRIARLKMLHIYTIDMQRESVGEIHFREREKAYKKFAENIVRHYAKLDERRDHETNEWVLRLSLRVVDEDLI